MKFDLSTEVIDATYIEVRDAHIEQMLGTTDDDHVIKLVKELRGIRAFITILKARVADQTAENQDSAVNYTGLERIYHLGRSELSWHGETFSNQRKRKQKQQIKCSPLKLTA